MLGACRWFVISAIASVNLAVIGVPANAATALLGPPHLVAHFDFGRGQTPENIALEPDGAADITLAFAAQVAQVTPAGRMRVLAQLPSATSGPGCRTPVQPGHRAVTTGIARDHRGTLYVGLCTGSSDLQGIWSISREGAVTRLAGLPENGLPTGLALDEPHGLIYVADSFLATIWRVSIDDGTVSAWFSGAQLAPSRVFPVGANGLKIHAGAVWVTNTAQSTLLRIEINPDGSAGPVHTVATALNGGVDDFTFVGADPEDGILAAFVVSSEVRWIRPNDKPQTVLTARDGLSNPTSVAIRHNRAYVISSAVFTHSDPNLLVARLDGKSDLHVS